VPQAAGGGTGVVVQDRGEISLGEAGVHRGVAQRPVHLGGSEQRPG